MSLRLAIRKSREEADARVGSSDSPHEESKPGHDKSNSRKAKAGKKSSNNGKHKKEDNGDGTHPSEESTSRKQTQTATQQQRKNKRKPKNATSDSEEKQHRNTHSAMQQQQQLSESKNVEEFHEDDSSTSSPATSKTKRARVDTKSRKHETVNVHQVSDDEMGVIACCAKVLGLRNLEMQCKKKSAQLRANGSSGGSACGWLKHMVPLLETTTSELDARTLQSAMNELYTQDNSSKQDKGSSQLIVVTRKALIGWLKTTQVEQQSSSFSELRKEIASTMVTWVAFMCSKYGLVSKPSSTTHELVKYLTTEIAEDNSDNSKLANEIGVTLVKKYGMSWEHNIPQGSRVIPMFHRWYAIPDWDRNSQDVRFRTCLLIGFYRGLQLFFEQQDIGYKGRDKRDYQVIHADAPSPRTSEQPLGASYRVTSQQQPQRQSNQFLDWPTKQRIARVLSKCHQVNLTGNEVMNNNGVSQIDQNGEFCKYYQSYNDIYVRDGAGNIVEEPNIPILVGEQGYTPKSLAWWGVQEPPTFFSRTGERVPSGWSDDENEANLPKKKRKRTPTGV